MVKIVAALGLACSGVNCAHAAEDIINTAELSAAVDGGAVKLRSNTVRLSTLGRIDLQLRAASTEDDFVRPGDRGHVSVFALTNSGSHDDAFVLTPTADIAEVTVTGIWADQDGDGRFDPNADILVGEDLTLGRNASATLFVLTDISLNMPDGARAVVSLNATSRAGSGPAGTVFRGANGEVMTGLTTAAATAETSLVARAETPDGTDSNAGIALEKSQAVMAAGALPVSGDVITYTLKAVFPAGASALDPRISDDVPAGTVYVPGSLTLDGRALTETPDNDAGQFEAGTLQVALGEGNAGVTRTVTFQVRIQ